MLLKCERKKKKCAERFSDLLKDLIIPFEKNKAFVQLKSQLFTELTMKIDIRQLEHLITVQVLIHCNHDPHRNHTTLGVNDRYLFFSKHWSNLFWDLSIICFQASGESKGGARDARPPRGSKFFQFHAVFGKIWQNRMLAPPRELAPPPRGNPWSATAGVWKQKSYKLHNSHFGLLMCSSASIVILTFQSDCEKKDSNFRTHTSPSICKIKCRSFQFLIRLTNRTP